MTATTTTPRTPEELAARLAELTTEGPIFDWELSVLLAYLPFDLARPYLSEGVTQRDWEGTQDRTPTRDRVLADMREYMEFAWEKALGHRGISASRSVHKMKAWLWLLGDDELLAYALGEENYRNYGAPILYRISQKYRFPIPKGQEVRNMAGGKSCQEGCGEGCG